MEKKDNDIVLKVLALFDEEDIKYIDHDLIKPPEQLEENNEKKLVKKIGDINDRNRKR